jgi:hypothetical protein
MNASGAHGARAWPLAFVAIAALWSVSCVAPLMKLPAGPGTPAPDADSALAQATARCHGIKTLTAEIAISGSAGGRRLRARLLAGVASPASVRLEATAPFGPPVFIFVATGDDATLLLPRDARVLEHGRPDAVLGAVAAIPFDAVDLFTTLIGCVPDGSGTDGRSLGPDWRLVHVAARQTYDVYLHRDGAAQPWRLVATVRQSPTDASWRTEYADFQNELPRAIRLRSTTSKDSGFDLALALSQVEINVPLGADVFRVEIPSSADPITVDELLRARLGIREN